MKILSVFGTRPEAVKMCPLIQEFQKNSKIESKICLTGQHEEMVDQIMRVFHLKEDYNLHIMRKNQTLTDITSAVLTGAEEILRREKPDIVFVHGDTTTSFAAGLASFYQKIPLGHVEAGLRTGNKYSPYPEEINRCLIARLADYHFAPTERNKRNLSDEGVKRHIYVTGNTVIDALKTTVKKNYLYHNDSLKLLVPEKRRVVLVTAHRRENFGRPLVNICEAVKELSLLYRDVLFIYPVHLNPNVRETVFSMLSGKDNVILTDPLDVIDMHNLMARCYFVMTDSGGLQEEAPALGKPVLVLRTETERMEAVEAGTVKMTGVEAETIVKHASELISSKKEYEYMAKAVNPYGDGFASKRIVNILNHEFGL